MGREEVRGKAWSTFRERTVQYAKEHPEYSLDDFKLQRADEAFVSWRGARTAERNHEWEKARRLYLKAVESYEQFEKLGDDPLVTQNLEMLKNEYYQFVVNRDPIYRVNLKYLLPLIREEPGILQTQTYDRLDISRPEITYTLYFAEKEGLVRREKKGRSYQLFFERGKPENDPFLSIQDDEIDIGEKAKREAIAKQGCSWFLSVLFWGAALGLGTLGGPFGVGAVVAAFIVWKIIQRKRRKKLEEEKPDQGQAGPILLSRRDLEKGPEQTP
jgi:hypothetical protein